MKRSSQGGRSARVWTGYCPHLRAKGRETYWGVRVLAVTQSPIPNEVHPGDEARVVFQLMYHARDFDYNELKRGATFEILGGARVVGTGVVLSDFEW